MRKRKYCFLFLALAVTFSCAKPEKKEWNIFWPQPPDEPRIKFVEIIATNMDVEEEQSFFKALIGEINVIGLNKPYGAAVDMDGKVYVTDIGGVGVFDKKNKKFSIIGDIGKGRLSIPIGIAISHQDGRIFVADSSQNKIKVYDKNGNFLGDIGKEEELDSPSGLAIDEKRQRIYVADAKKHCIKAYSLDGNFLFSIGKRGKDKGELNFPTNVALDSSSNIYVSDTQNFRVQVFDPEGNYIKQFGELGDRLGSFARPKGIAIDAEDHIYVVDAAFNNIQVFDKEGALLLYVGEGGYAPGQFMSPAGIAIDHEDKIYVVEQINKRVQVLQYLGDKWRTKQEGQTKPVETK